MKQIKITIKHLHFVILAVILGLGAISFFFAGNSRGIQLLIGLVTTGAYVAWGFIYHALEGDLYKKVVVEYLLIGVIAILLLLTIVGP